MKLFKRINMKKLPINKRKTTKESFYEEARSLFVSGRELDEIAKILSVSLNLLKEWQLSGQWERKKKLIAEHPKLISEVLKGLVKQRVEMILDDKEKINLSNIEELTKIINLIERLEEYSWDERAAVVEVMSLFGEFVRQHVRNKEELQLLTKLMEKFFAEMEGK